MSAIKAYWEEVALREFGVITAETLEKAKPIAQAELDSAALSSREHPPLYFKMPSLNLRRLLDGEGDAIEAEALERRKNQCP
jgi:hypothetical protein